MQQALPPPREVILKQLERMRASETFAGAERSRAFLKFLVEQTLANQADRLKEYTIGSEALGRGESFDPRTDPIVRAEASRLRSRIERYYATNGTADTVLITLPKGSYVPQFEFRSALGGTLTEAGETGGHRASIWFDRLVWFAIGGVAAAVVVGSALWVREPTRPGPELGTLQFQMELGSGSLSLGSDHGTDLTLSPDGSRIVFVVRESDGQLRLVTRDVEEFGESTARDLPGTLGSRLPFSSPNGAWVGFWADGKIKKTAIDGGKPVVLADAPDFGGASWVEDDNFIAVLGQAIVRVPASPGPTSVIRNLQPDSVHPRWPDVLPGARHVLITTIAPPGSTNIEAVSLTDGTRKIVWKGGTFGRYRDGHLVYMNQGTLYAIRFDADTLSTDGTAVPVLSSASYEFNFGFAQLDIARNGTLVYRRSVAQSPRVVSWIDRTGHVEPFFNRPDSYQFPRLSPTSQRAYVSMTDSGVGQAGAIGGSGTTAAILGPAPDRMTRLAPPAGSLSGVWTVNGRFLVIGSMKGLYWARADELSHFQPLLTGAATLQVASSFSRDGKYLAYHEVNPSTAFDLWTVSITESAGKLSAGKPELFLRTPSHETYPSFSPDGRWIAYGTGQYGPWEVYVRPFPKTAEEAIKVSDGGGRIPRWLNSGELVYRTDDHRLMIVPYSEKNGAFVPGKPREWTGTRLADTGVINNFDVDSDGTRVLGLLPADSDADRHNRNSIIVVLNFFEEVRRKVSQ
jgi:serine/threonine-protein kinase